METTVISTTILPTRSGDNKSMFSGFRLPSPDLLILLGILVATNLHIITGNTATAASLIFLPDPATSGQWYRLFTHPFVHVSWYHMLLDAGAFFLLYTGLEEKRSAVRIFYLTTCGTASLIFAVSLSPLIDQLGLCGLSGIAHGLMAVSALEMMRTPANRTIGLISLTAVILKSLYELITGTVLLEFLQFGMCGTPMAACHAGGTLGGIGAFGGLRLLVRFGNR